MRRRDVLTALGTATAAGGSGCLGLFETRTVGEPPLVENRPKAVYFPTHVEGMQMIDVQTSGGYKCALALTFPHRFWLVTGDRREKVEIQPDDSVHPMPIVWDVETGIVPPDLTPQLTLTQDGESVTELSPWPMLSQPMGFHFGDNVQLQGNGRYQVEVTIGSPSTRRTRSLADNRGQASFAFDFAFEESMLDAVMYRDIPSEKQGRQGAVKPMRMGGMMPSTQVPEDVDLPGTVRGAAVSGDALFVVTTLSDATPFGGGETDTYLGVSPRTPYNRYMVPMMSLSGVLSRGDQRVFDGILQSAIDPELNYHYGAVVSSFKSGDELSITVDSPPQTARHEGYETAFLEMETMTIPL